MAVTQVVFCCLAGGSAEVQLAQDSREYVPERNTAFSAVTIKRAKRAEKKLRSYINKILSH